MKFKHARLERELEGDTHPALRAYLYELDRFCIAHGYAEVELTELVRSDRLMGIYYPPPTKGPHKGKTWKERGLFSWHLPDKILKLTRAADVRNRVWLDVQRFAIVTWTKKYWPGFEVLMHDIGRGDHFHVAVPGPWSMIKRLRRAAMIRKATKATT